VAEQVDGLARRVMVEQHLEVGQVIGKPVGIRLDPFGQAEAAPVVRDDVPIALQAIDDELERGADIHPAMHHEQFGRALAAPVAHVGAQAADGEKFGTGRRHGGFTKIELPCNYTPGVDFLPSIPIFPRGVK